MSIALGPGPDVAASGDGGGAAVEVLTLPATSPRSAPSGSSASEPLPRSDRLTLAKAPGSESWWQTFMLDHTVAAIGVACAINAVLVSLVVTAIAVP